MNDDFANGGPPGVHSTVTGMPPPQKMNPQSLTKWAGSDGSEQARAGRMVPGSRPGTAQVPFPKISREQYLALVGGSGIPRLAEKAKIVPVRLDELRAIQSDVNLEQMTKHANDPLMNPPGSRASGSGMPIDRPIVVRKNGQLFIHDGHHRLTLAKLRGSGEALVRLVDLDVVGAAKSGTVP